MRIKRSKLVEMIEGEVRRALAEVSESDGDEKPKKKGSKKPTQAAADEEPTDDSQPQGGGPDPIQSAPPVDGGMNDVEGDLDVPAPDPTDGEGEDDGEAIDSDGDGGEEPSGAINDELSGKTVQAVTIEPKSKVLPGSKEIVFTFNESTDALRVLVTPTGQIKFFWRGQLHDIP